MAEDVGRSEIFNSPKYADPKEPGPRKAWRWGEPDSGNGITGPLLNGGWPTFGDFAKGYVRMINNNSTPYGGPPSCPWLANHCGPNQEIFSFHGNGTNALFLDGSVRFLHDTIHPLVLRRICTPIDSDPVDISEY